MAGCLEPPIEADGNLNAEASSQAVSQGAGILVGGTSSIFRDGNDLCAACIGFREEVRRLCAKHWANKLERSSFIFCHLLLMLAARPCAREGYRWTAP
jgi:hypothetical protein